MVNTQLIVLKLMLQKSETENNLEHYERLKTNYFNNSFAKVYTAIGNYYNKFSSLPTLGELALSNSRDRQIQEILSNIEVTNIPDEITLPLAINALLDEYAQLVVLKEIKTYINNLPFLDANEIVEHLSELTTKISDEIETTGHETTGREILLFKTLEDTIYKFFNCAINQTWDILFNGIARQDLILAGGYRGTGKSVLCTNFAANEYQQGNIAPYYTIEMSANEVQDRILGVLAKVRALGIRNQNLEGGELVKLAITRSKMFVGGFEVLVEYLKENEDKLLTMHDFHIIEKSLVKLPLKHPLLVYDDSQLKISTIDVHLSKLKSKYGELLTLAVVDYLNQLRMEGVDFTDRLDWKNQIHLATALKQLARKNDCGIFAPYQVDENGQVRLSKGILDAVDASIVLSREKQGITFDINKMRNLPVPDSPLSSKLDWNTLAVILHQELPIELEEREPDDSARSSNEE